MITFLSPGFLFALSLITIPVIVHLFNFRRFKKVLFTNVRFLQELKQETTSKSKLKHLLVLTARILAVAFLVFAFARPVIPAATQVLKKTSQQAVSIFVDNSFTMEAIRTDGTLLEVAKNKAREIVGAFPSSAQFQLLTADFDPVHQRLVNKEDFLEMLDQVKTGNSTHSLNEIIKRQQEALQSTGQRGGQQFIISDFQANMITAQTLAFDSSFSLSFIPVRGTTTDNIYIDSCWFSVPVVQLNQPAELNIRVFNRGEQDADNIPLRVNIDGQAKAVTALSVPSRQSAITTVNFTISNAGWHKGDVSLTDHPVTFDDSYYFSFEVSEAVAVMAINGSTSSEYLKALFADNSFFRFTNSNYTQVDYRLLQQQNLVVLNQLREISSGMADELQKFLNAGGHVVLFPDSNAERSSYNNFLGAVSGIGFGEININSDKVVSIDKTDELFEGVFQQGKRQDEAIDFPVATRHFDLLQSSQNNQQVLMRLQGGGSFLSKFKKGKGTLYIFTVPLQPGFSNLARHAVFVPALYKMALLSLRSHDLAFVIGNDAALQLDGLVTVTEENFRLLSDDKKNELIPKHYVSSNGITISFSNLVNKAGHYELMNGPNLISVASFNYNRSESDMRLLTDVQLNDLMKENHVANFQTLDASFPDLGKKLKQLSEGISLWKYCIALVLLFLFLETLLLRFWKT